MVLPRTTCLNGFLREPKGAQPFSLFARGLLLDLVLVPRLFPFVAVPLQFSEFGLCFGNLRRVGQELSPLLPPPILSKHLQGDPIEHPRQDLFFGQGRSGTFVPPVELKFSRKRLNNCAARERC